MVEKMLGKITSATFGVGGYQDAMIGLTITIGGRGWGTSTFKGSWSLSIEVGPHAKWTEVDRDKQFSETVRFIDETLRKAKVSNVSQLVGIPIEAEFDDRVLKSWRVLEDVL
jgi:hypothetical protein